MGDVWAEAWTLPELGSFTTRRMIPGVVKVRDPISGIGRGTVVVPADWDGLNELLGTDTGSLIRVVRRNGTARQVIFEFTPETSTEPYTEPTGTLISLSGPSIEAKLDQAVVLPFDYPTNPSVDSDWVYGFTNLLEGTNVGFEENPYALTNPDAEDGTTDGWPTTGTRFDAIAPEQFEAKTGAGADTGSWYFEVTGDAGEGIYQDFNVDLTEGDTYIVTARLYVPTGKTVRMEVTHATAVSVGSLFNGAAYADAVGNDAYQTVTVNFTAGDGSAGNGVSFLAQDAATTFRLDNVTAEGRGIGTDGWSVRGTVDVFAGVPTTTVPAPPVHSGSRSLAWHPNSGTAGNDSLYIPVRTTPGTSVTGSIWVYHTEGADETFRLVLRIPGVNPNTQSVASAAFEVPTATWTQLIASGVATTSFTELEVRYDETGAPANNIYFDDAAFYTGNPPAPVGEILGDLLTDVGTTHAAESDDFDIAQLTWLKPDFTDTLDSNGDAWDEDLAIAIPALLSFGQLMDRLARLGYEWRIVPNPDWPATDTESHLLQVTNPWDASAYTGGLGTDKTATVKITAGQAILDGPVKRTELSRTVALSMDPDGALAVARDATGETNWGQRVAGAREQAIYEGSVQRLADQLITDRAQTVSASQVEFLEVQYKPYVDFEPGDTITFGLPPDLTDAAHRVATIQYDVIDHDVVWHLDFDRAVYSGLSGTIHAVDRLLRRAADPERKPSDVAVAVPNDATGGVVDPTIFVAASNARTALKAAADYVCSGTNDHLEIQAAFDALPAAGGRVQLSEGTFAVARSGGTLSAAVIRMPTNTELVGVGPGTLIDMSGSGYVGIGTAAASDYKTRIANLRVDVADCTGTGYALYVVGSGVVESCWFTGLGQSGSEGGYIGTESSSNGIPIITDCHFLDVYQGGC